MANKLTSIQTSAPANTRSKKFAGVAARVAVALVFMLNVQCALSFALWPAAYAGGFELADAGVAGEAAVRGLGIAFLMWNVTYPGVIANPRRFRSLYVVVLIQQVVGLVGETWVRFALPAEHATLAASIERFILFDAAGLVLMASAFVVLALVDRRGTTTAQQALSEPR